jgi:hypothetical protein
MNPMAVIMDNYAKFVHLSSSYLLCPDAPSSQLAEQCGSDVASEVMARSRSNLQLDAMPQVGYK